MGAWPEYDPKNDPDALKEGGGDYGVNEPGYYLDGNFVYVKGSHFFVVFPLLPSRPPQLFRPPTPHPVDIIAASFVSCYQVVIKKCLGKRQIVEPRSFC